MPGGLAWAVFSSICCVPVCACRQPREASTGLHPPRRTPQRDRPFCLRGSHPLRSPGAGAGQGGLLHPSPCWLCRAGPCRGAQPRPIPSPPSPSRPVPLPLGPGRAGPCPAHCGRGEGRRRPARAARVPVTHCRYEPANQRAPSGVPARRGFFLESSSAGKSSPSPPPSLPSPLPSRPASWRAGLPPHTHPGPSSPLRGAPRGCGEAARGVREGPHGQRGGEPGLVSRRRSPGGEGAARSDPGGR